MENQIKTITDWLDDGSIDIFGLPFSGKDTQGRIIAEKLGGELIAGGDILRSHDDPKKIEEVLANGGIVPSDFYINLVLPYLSQAKYRTKPLILSAVGRAHGEEPIIMKAVSDSGHPMKAVVYLKMPETIVWQRFEASLIKNDRGNRSDDHREVIKNRLKKFHDRTVPVIDYYREKGMLVEVDGTQPLHQVTESILNGLAELGQS